MVTIGIVGAGLRGRLFAEALQGQPDVTVVGLAEPSAKVAEEARDATGLPVTASHAELLEAFDPDAVIVAPLTSPTARLPSTWPRPVSIC